jgi:hypothetical protein
MIQIIGPNNDEYFVLQMHHCVDDGWSVGLYMNDFQNAYRRQLNTTSIEFQRFVEFVEHQDPDKMKAFWLEYLDGVEPSTMFSQLQEHVGTRGKGEKELNVTKSAVLQYCNNHQITESTLLKTDNYIHLKTMLYLPR